MLHVITLFSVSADAAGPFAHSIQRGEWHTLSRSFAPSLIATDLLELQPPPEPQFRSPVLFLCIYFWSSPAAYRRACQQPASQALLLARRQMAGCAVELGEFCFPKPLEIEDLVAPAVAECRLLPLLDGVHFHLRNTRNTNARNEDQFVC
jgi:hypothetical protein